MAHLCAQCAYAAPDCGHPCCQPYANGLHFVAVVGGTDDVPFWNDSPLPEAEVVSRLPFTLEPADAPEPELEGLWEWEPTSTSDVLPCPFCNADAPLLGVVGILEWHRCPDCGIDFYPDPYIEEEQ